jgi:TetR/AcrR family transcriptional regulator, regulator of biofilm formation and stress response
VTDGRIARGAARRDVILRAAVDVVAAGGASALTHRSVADRAGVPHATVAYHFKTAADLRLETFRSVGSTVGFDLHDLIDATDGSPEAIPAACTDFLERLVTDRRPQATTVFEMMVAASYDPGLREQVVFFHERLAELLLPLAGSADLAAAAGAALQGLALRALAEGPAGADRATLERDVAAFAAAFRVR